MVIIGFSENKHEVPFAQEIITRTALQKQFYESNTQLISDHHTANNNNYTANIRSLQQMSYHYAANIR